MASTTKTTPKKTNTKKKKQQQPMVQVILQDNTKNKSFIKMYKDLKKEGIENNGFMLGLFNPNLLEKDPYDPRLMYDDVRQISNEAEMNMWYYLRECLMVKKAIGTGEEDHLKLTKQVMGAFWSVANGYSILLDMDRKYAMQIAHSIFLYFHQCGIKRHFEVISKDDESQYELTEYSAYHLLAPMYIYSQNNTEPIFYETEEVLFDEMKYRHASSMLYVDNTFGLEGIDEAWAKWKGISGRKPLLILTHDNKNDDGINKDLYNDIIENNSIEWDNAFIDKASLMQPYKKSGVIVISK